MLFCKHRNVETSSEVSDRTNSAPAVVQTVQQAESSSSKHISFDTNILGRPRLSTEQIVKFGRHSSDIRLRRCLGLTTRSKSKMFGSKCMVSKRFNRTCNVFIIFSCGHLRYTWTWLFNLNPCLNETSMFDNLVTKVGGEETSKFVPIPKLQCCQDSNCKYYAYY